MDLVVDWRQVHALLGENGAGKSTLMNVVYGMVSSDGGEIIFDGTPAHISGAAFSSEKLFGIVWAKAAGTITASAYPPSTS